MAKETVTYEEITKARISDARNLVISRCSKGGYTLAQQMVVRDGKSEVAMFLKGAIHIKDVEAMKSVRDALDIVIAESEAFGEVDPDYWK